MSDIAKAFVALRNLPEIYKAAQTLAQANLLNGERPADVVKRYVQARPEINVALSQSQKNAWL